MASTVESANRKMSAFSRILIAGFIITIAAAGGYLSALSGAHFGDTVGQHLFNEKVVSSHSPNIGTGDSTQEHAVIKNELPTLCVNAVMPEVMKDRLSAESKLTFLAYIPPQKTDELMNTCIVKVEEVVKDQGIPNMITGRYWERQFSVTVNPSSGEPVRIFNLSNADSAGSVNGWSLVDTAGSHVVNR